MANKNILGFNLSGSDTYYSRPYGTCSTAATTAAKAVTWAGFILTTGATILVKFSNANSASSPTLNVNSTGAKTIIYHGSALTSSLYYWSAGDVCEFVYDGTYWVLMNVGNTDTWRDITDSVSTTSSSICASATAVKTAYDKANHSHPYLSTSGGLITGDLRIHFSDTDKFVMWDYDGDATAGASWRIGALGSGSGNTNYFVLQSGTSGTTATAWTNIFTVGQNDYNVYFTNTPYVGSTKVSLEGHTHNYLPLTGGTLTGLLTITTNGKSVTIGSRNESWCHYETTAPSHWFNKSVAAAGDFYGGTNYNRRLAYADELDSSSSKYAWSSDILFDCTTKKFSRKTAANSWNTQAYSVYGYVSDCMLSFKAGQTNAYIMVGLNSDPTTDASYTSIDYCWYIQSGGALCIYENGNPINVSKTTYTTGDDFRIVYDGNYVRYYCNGTLYRSIARSVSGKLYFDSSFYNAGNIYDVEFAGTIKTDWNAITNKPSTYTPAGHTHDDRYYTESEVNTKLGSYLPLTGGTMSGPIFNSISCLGDNLAKYTYTSGSITGTIKITLPMSWSSTMGMYEIWVYEYSGVKAGSKILVGGYNYGSTGYYNYTYSTQGTYTRGVRFAHDGSKCCILLGNTGSTWEYPNIFLKAVAGGHSGSYVLSNGYSISLITSEDGLSYITSVDRSNEYANAFYQSSDERLKTFYDPINVDLDKLKALRKNYFKFNDKDEMNFGVSAQEIQSLYPEIVSESEDGYLSVAYDKLSVVALAAVDKLTDKIETLEDENKLLKERLDKIEKMLNI